MTRSPQWPLPFRMFDVVEFSIKAAKYEEIKKTSVKHNLIEDFSMFFFFDSTTHNTTGYVLNYRQNVVKHNF